MCRRKCRTRSGIGLVDGFPTADRPDGTLRGMEEGAPLPGQGRNLRHGEPTMANNTRQILRILNDSNLRLFEKLDLIDGMGTGQNKN
jgi:hypothetical protein